ncbi:LacI family DNA-binding transcriptional regulator [Paenarthrobacter sp. NPDC058040]|uniref:LacI family DNA-binding transcriptional regulator n=1 Tax=unclassified Paenarthrobacter TaxID=2634190 RepID=UPI0036DD4563
MTLADVSKAAGVGVATVSRALAAEEHRDVSASTRARIREIADQLGYRPSTTARALRSGGYHAISVVVPDDAWGWWEPTVRSAYQAAADKGYQVLVHPIAGRKGGAASVVESLANVPTEGVLLFGSAGDISVKEAADRLRLPVVTIDDVTEETVLPTIATDNRSGACEAVAHLAAIGNTRIAYVGSGNEDALSRARLSGYHDALAAAGLPADKDLIVSCSRWVDESVVTHPEVDRLIDQIQDIDAIFCEFDLMAAPVLRSLRAKGLRVPADISVVGFDGERAAQLLDPPLTTMRQPYEEMGEKAVLLLLKAIGGQAISPQRQLLKPRLIPGLSTEKRTGRI